MQVLSSNRLGYYPAMNFSSMLALIEVNDFVFVNIGLDVINMGNNHKQVPTTYYSMMFNIHKHISHLIFVLVPECGEYEICNQNIILRCGYTEN
jgi:hypothetical protein